MLVSIIWACLSVSWPTPRKTNSHLSDPKAKCHLAHVDVTVLAIEATIVNSLEIKIPDVCDWLPIIRINVVKVDLAILEVWIQREQNLLFAKSAIRIEEKGN